MRDKMNQRWLNTLRTSLAVLSCAAALSNAGSAIAALVPTASQGKPAQELVDPADAFPIEHRRIHYAGDIWMSISNDGSLGTNSGTIIADRRDMDALKINYGPSFEFPAGTRVDYLFNGSLWVGGIVGSDTLVSAAKGSGSGDAFEWNGYTEVQPGTPPDYYTRPADTSIVRMSQAYWCVYSDTLVRPNTSDDVAGRLHLPLGVEVLQTTHQGNNPYTKRFIIYDYAIRNISDHDINEMWFGVFLDNDVFWEDVTGCSETRTEDDLSGCMTTWPNPDNPIYTDSLLVAWAMDNEGDACGAPRFPRVSARGAMGMRVLRGPTADSRVNFNWFTTNFGNLDWGPRHASDNYTFGTGGTGLPPGDAATYHVMSNGEIDYSQPFAAIDYRPEWVRPSVNGAANIANGLDSRVCISTGPLPVLHPEEVTHFTIAFIGGADVHINPSNAFDALNPQPFMDRLDFSDLATNAWWAGFVWDNYGIDSDPNDGNDFRGEFYRPVISGDTVYYSGDGIPDLLGPEPPPCPDTLSGDLKLESRPGELTITWTGDSTETFFDPLRNYPGFQGYRVYIAERSSRSDAPSSAEYSLVAQWDRVDYKRFEYNDSTGLWDRVRQDLSRTTEEWQVYFGDPTFDPLAHSGPSLETAYKYQTEDGEVRAYFAPEGENRGNEYLVGDNLEQNMIQQIGIRDTLVRGILLKVGEYRITLKNLLPARHYFVNVTALDYDNPDASLLAQESGRGSLGCRCDGIPVYSADVVEEYNEEGGDRADSVKVSVYPNPYKIAFTDGSGQLSSYFEQGYEGVTGQNILNEQDRRIHFINLPDTCEINIYTLDGDLVRTLTHPDVTLSGYSSKISWDLISRNTQAVTSGIYLYRVDSRLGSQVGKIVIIK